MPVRRFDLYIDGVRLPSYFLSDGDTQLGVRNDLLFVGRVQRFFGDEDPFDPDVHPGEWFAPAIHERFAALGRLLSFRLRPSRAQGVAVKVGHSGVVRWREIGDPVFREVRDRWSELRWDTTYVLCTAEGLHTQMTVEVRRRAPLRAMGSVLNRSGPASDGVTDEDALCGLTRAQRDSI